MAGEMIESGAVPKVDPLKAAIEEVTQKSVRCCTCRGIRQIETGQRCPHCKGSGIEPKGCVDRVDVKK